MGKTIKSILLVFIILIILFTIVLKGKLFGNGYTAAITNQKGEAVQGSITVLEKVRIGDMEQWLSIRGDDITKPILLWLHGGPGSSQMPIAYHYHKELEKDFIIVQWDQRGAGKSNPSKFDEKTMTFDQFLQDTHEITQYLKKKYNKEKIYLLGHSWGTHLGLKAAQAHPEDYYAYIGVSQVVDYSLSDKISYGWLVNTIKDNGEEKDARKLKELGIPPYTDHEKYVKFINMVNKYGGGFDINTYKLFSIALQAPEYTVRDYIAWLRGANRGSGLMWSSEAYYSFNAMRDVPTLEVPAYFLNGVNDYNTPLQLVEEYYNTLEAEKGKKLIIFKKSAHTPFFAETEKFNIELLKIKRETHNQEKFPKKD